MLDIDIRKRLSITDDYCEDDKGNPTYYYCQVYADETQEIELDYFSIRKDDVEDIKDFKQIEKFAIENVRDCLPHWIADYYKEHTK